MRKTGLTILGVLLLILILAVVQVFRPLPMLKIQPAVAAVPVSFTHMKLPTNREGVVLGDGAKTGLTILVVLLLILILAVVQVFRPLPMLKIQPAVAAVQAVPGTVSFHWPTTGQAVVGIEGVGLMGQYGPETPVPIASLTKMMTALLGVLIFF